MATSKRNYIDNPKFLQALIEYREVCRAAESKGLDRRDPRWPRLPEYIGECFLKIAQRLSLRLNFLKYTYREDMIGDGVTNCLQAVHNFNPDKYSNPFAYFTQITYWAFVRNIEGEKDYTYNKQKILQHMGARDGSATQDHDTETYDNTYVKFLQKNQGDIIAEYEAKKAKKRRSSKKQPKGLETFFCNEETPEDLKEILAEAESV